MGTSTFRSARCSRCWRGCRRHLKDTNWGPLAAVGGGNPGRLRRRPHERLAHRLRRLPACIASLGTFYWARGVGSSIVAGTQLNGFPEIVRSHRKKPLRAPRRHRPCARGRVVARVCQGGKRADNLGTCSSPWSRGLCSATPPTGRRSTRSAATNGPRISLA